MQKYCLEFIIATYNVTEEAIKNSLREFGDALEINHCQAHEGKGKEFKVNINTEDPTVIFDICSQFGRIKTVKIN